MNATEIIRQIKQVNKSKRGIHKCSVLKRTDTIETLLNTLVSDAGLTFVKQTNYPSIDIFRAYENLCENKGIVIDKGISITNVPFIFLVGNSFSNLVFDCNKEVYHVYLMHGAKAKIHATNGALVSLHNISGEAQISADFYGRIIKL